MECRAFEQLKGRSPSLRVVHMGLEARDYSESVDSVYEVPTAETIEVLLRRDLSRPSFFAAI